MSQFALADGIASSAGVVDRDGVRLAYAVAGEGSVTLLLLPTWSIVRSEFWKLQVPYLARHYRVVTFDGRGSGDSGRPTGAAAYGNAEYAADAVAVLDATGTDRAVVVGLSCAGSWGVHLAAEHPERVSGLLALSPACGFDLPTPHRDAYWWGDHVPTTEGWAKYNKYYWLEGDYDDFLRFFFAEMYPEPHSTKQIEDCVGWGLECGADALIASEDGAGLADATAATAAAVLCPLLVIHGADDALVSHAAGVELARITGGTLATIEGGGHCPQARDPVLVNRLIRDFVDSLEAGDAT